MEGDDGRESLDAKGSRGTERGTSQGHPAEPSAGGRRTPAVGANGAGTWAGAIDPAKSRNRSRGHQTPHRPGVGAPTESLDAIRAARSNLRHRAAESSPSPGRR